MLRFFRAYPSLLCAYWARALEYRVQALIWFLVGTYPLVMMAVWIGIAQGGTIAGYDASDFIAYYLGVTWMRRITYLWILDDIEERIRTGELSAFLLRPLNLVHHLFTSVLASRAMQTILSGLIIGVVALLVPGQQFDLSPGNLLLFAACVAVGFVFEFFLQYMVGALAFWTTQVYRIFDIVWFVKSFLGGFVVPLNMLPPALQNIVQWLPFQSSMGLPVEILIGQATPERALQGILVSLVWVIGMAGASRFIWRAGLRSYSAVGA